MTAWGVLLRGIRHRFGRSLVVLALAVVATTATVLVPAYSRAAEQSVLTDGLRAAPVTGTSLAIGAEGTAAASPAAHGGTAEARDAVTAALRRHPTLAGLLDRPVGGIDTEALVTGRPVPLATRFAYRDNACAHLRIVQGECFVEPGEVLVSERAAAHGIAVGDALALRLGGAQARAQSRGFTVVGIYAPKDTTEPYWGHTAYFGAGGTTDGAERIDAVFTSAEDDVARNGEASVGLWLEYPLRTGAVRLDDVGALRTELGSFGLALRAAELELDTALPATLDSVAADQQGIRRTVPVIAVPLVLLCWFVLFLLVASLTEERGAEIALAKLRGYPAGRAARFGLGEVLLLTALAAPLGVLAGLFVVEVAARLTLADTIHAEVRWPVFAAAGVALAATALAVLLAGRRILRRGVLGLLRRVPERARWQAGVADGLAVALAGASLFAAISEPDGPLALLAPALLAVVAGVVAARLLAVWSRLRLRVARRRGRVPALLSAAQLARRPASHRVVVVVTVAVALLAFAATAWDVAARARQDAAVDTVGAAHVYTVSAAHPRALAKAVAEADPGGHSMAVVRVSEPYADGRVELVGVQAQLLPEVAAWRGQDRAAVARLADALRPTRPEPLRVKDHLEVHAAVTGLSPTTPVRFSALVSSPGEPPRTVPLGQLAAGPRAYRASVSECRAGCDLLGFALSRAGTAPATYSVQVAVRGIRSNDGDLAARFDARDAWVVRGSPAGATVRSGDELSISVTSGGQQDVVVDYLDTPAALPVVLAGPVPSDDSKATQFAFPGLVDEPQTFAVAARAPRLPRAGAQGLLFDFEYAVHSAERRASLADAPELRYEVWSSPSAPPDLGARLGAAGVQVLRTESIDAEMDYLGRRAPALGLRLYLLAGAAAVALAVGVVMLTAYVGVRGRLYELAALWVAGVRRRTLRRGLLREYAALLAMPLVAGLAAGFAGALLMLPNMPLVTVAAPVGDIAWRPAAGALPLALAVTVLGLLLTVAVVLRMLRRATPERLSEGVGR